VRRLAFILSLCAACALALGAAGVAAADVFGPIELVSSRPVQLASGTFSEQAERAEESVIAGEGRYVAFVGAFGGVRGIWRRDLETGAVEQVAPSAALGEAKLPSISADGRYVSFTTTARLAPEDDHNHASDVYVRDMDKPCQIQGGACLACGEHQDEAEREGCPFALVSAVDGSSEGATYVYAKPGEEEASLGSFASGRSAMSANGRYVAFETEAESNLLGDSTPTPAREILVRDLQTEQTRLVSSEYDPQTGTDTGVPVPLTTLGAEQYGAAYPVVTSLSGNFGGASISAEGNTVAWLGQEIGRQARLLPAEQGDYDLEYDEPLWRRIDEGPSAPTRRVTGGSEPENPPCAAGGESQLPSSPNLSDPCQGPFTSSNLPEPKDYLLNASEGADFVPQLSADGDTVAFLVSAQEAASGEAFAEAGVRDDLYVSTMAGGLTRVQALRRLTEIAGNSTEEQLARIVDLAISPDGSEVAFTTRRTLFPLGSISYVSPIAGKAGVNELFDVDLADDTLTRVTHGYVGEAVPSEKAGSDEEAGAGASSPSFSESGDTLSFSSNAYNLVYGDGNGASDAFVVNRAVFAEDSSWQYVSPSPPPPPLSPAWSLYATAAPQADGAVVLYVSVPGAGSLGVGASAGVPVALAAARSARRHAPGRGTAKARTALVTRTVASDRAMIPASTDGLERLTLTLAPSYRALAQRSGGLYAAIALRFTAPGHPPVSASLHVTFHRATPVPRSARATHSSVRRKGRRR
jgi:hypothetical protein